jgi:hypothetical protein
MGVKNLSISLNASAIAIMPEVITLDEGDGKRL